MSKSKQNKKAQLVESDSDSDSDITINDGGESRVDVGLIDDDLEGLTEDDLKLNRILMRSPFFTSKVGGKPAWLDYSNVPLAVGAGTMTDSNNNSKKQITLECDQCKTQLVFLLQIYAPILESDKFFDQVEDTDSFHRVLFVFLCANTQCASRTFKVLRSQINRKNDFFSYDAPPELNDDESDYELCKTHLKPFYKNLFEKNLLNLCPVCGLSCTKKCAKCSFSFYCSQSHQVFDWSKMNHKALCSKYDKNLSVDEIIENWIDDENSSEKMPNETGNHYFPEYEIVIEPEELDYSKLNEKKFKYDEKKIAESLNAGDDGNDNDFDNIKENDYDKDFEKFKKISAHEPTQIVRYERGGKPLWCTKYSKLSEDKVPPCEHCGAKRIFEFQITPQLLVYLKLEEGKQLNSIDWAGLYVYTCVRNCQAAHNSYATEYIYKQDFVS